MADLLRRIAARNRAGERTGIWALCSAHPLALEAGLVEACESAAPLLVEATCNQVNQHGGYTGQTPAAFAAALRGQAARLGLPPDRLILGGDHLGPNPWRHLPAATALAEAARLVHDAVAAGFTKIHLDTSMACADDPAPPADAVIAGRAADLAVIAERAAAGRLAHPVYVIGTEVPTPGGAAEALDHLAVTTVAALEQTIELHAAAFAARGIEEAWERVVAVVVQPGVEFGQDEIHDFVPAQAAGLAAAIGRHAGLVFEAHSTDYQRPAALVALVDHHFAILKVGPALTFALREAVFALDAIEREWLPAARRSGVRAALDAAMLREPEHWQGHHHGDAAALAFARAFSLSDRCRYYWPEPTVAAALDRLIENLGTTPIPMTLLSQYLPAEHEAVRAGRLGRSPHELIHERIRAAMRPYARACGLSPPAPLR